MKSLHDKDGWWNIDNMVESKDWEGRTCVRCPSAHWLPEQLVGHDYTKREFCCLQCRLSEGDLVILSEPQPIRGYVCVVVAAGAEKVQVRFVDAPRSDEGLWYVGDEALTLVKTGKKDSDLAVFGPELCAEAVEREMSAVEFVLRKRGGRKAKVKSAEDVVMEKLAKALVKKARETGKIAELLKEVGV